MKKSILFCLLLSSFFCSEVIESEPVSFEIGDENKKQEVKFSEFLTRYYNTNKVVVGVKEYILIDATTNTVLLSKNEKKKMYPSSMTKMMTLYILFDHIDSGKLKIDDIFTVSENAHRKQGSKMFLASGEQVSVNDLISGIIVVSGNDAALTVAENIAGSEEAFKTIIDEYLAKLGMRDTVFQNCTGWPNPDHFSSAHDIALLAMRLWKDFPQFNRRFSQTKFSHNNIKQRTFNDLLFHNKNIDGIKTGHTDAGGYGVAVTYRCMSNPDRRFFVVVNGARNEKERREDVMRLLSFAERNFGNYRLFQKDQIVKNIPLLNGVEKEVGAVLKDDIILSLDKADANKIRCFVTYDTPMNHIQKGEKIAELAVRIGNTEKKYNLYANRTVEEANIFIRCYNNIKYILFGNL